MRHKIPAVGSAVLTLFAIASLSAHHSPSAIFDMGKRITVTGTLLGNRALARIPEPWFRRMVAVVLAVLGAVMLTRGILDR